MPCLLLNGVHVTRASLALFCFARNKVRCRPARPAGPALPLSSLILIIPGPWSWKQSGERARPRPSPAGVVDRRHRVTFHQASLALSSSA